MHFLIGKPGFSKTSPLWSNAGDFKQKVTTTQKKMKLQDLILAIFINCVYSHNDHRATQGVKGPLNWVIEY